MATEDLKTQAGWDAFVSRHHGFTGRRLADGQELLSTGAVRDTKNGQTIPPDEVKWTYTFGDGTSMDIDNLRNVSNLDEKAPSVATGTKTAASGEWSQTEYRDDASGGTETKWGVDPADGVFKPMPGTQRPKQPKYAPAGQLERLDAMGRVIPPTDTTTVPAKVRDPISGTIADMPDPKTGTATYKEFGDDLYLLAPGQPPQKVLSGAAGAKKTTFQGPNGSQWEYDPSKPPGQRASMLVAGETKPDVASSSEIIWTDIPGTNSQQASRVVDGKQQPIEGMTKPKTTTMVGDANSKKWTFLDAEGNVVRTVDNPAYVEKRTPVSAPADQRFIGRESPEGNITWTENRNYQPKTTADIQARTGQIQSLMLAKGQEIKDQYKDNPEEGVRQFNLWYDQNVQGQIAELQRSAEEANFTRAKELADQRRQAFQQAQTAGNQAVQAYQASGLSRVGPRAAEVANQVSNQTNTRGVDWGGAAFFDDSGPGSVGARAAAASQAAYDKLMAGVPEYTPLSPTNELDRTRYMPQFAAAQAAAPAAAAPAATTYPWERADQNPGPTLAGDAMAAAGQAGTVPVGAPQYLGVQATPEQIAAAQGLPPPLLEEAPPDFTAVAPVMKQAPYVPPSRRPRVQSIVPVAPTPIPAAAPWSGVTPGFGFDPTNIQIVQGPQGPRALAAARRGQYPYEMPNYIPPVPGFGYDPSSFGR